MIDRPARGFALGYLAAGSAVELASEVAAVIARAGRASTVVDTADLQALIEENRQLHAQNTALRLDIESLETYANELETWGEAMKARADAQSG